MAHPKYCHGASANGEEFLSMTKYKNRQSRGLMPACLLSLVVIASSWGFGGVHDVAYAIASVVGLILVSLIALRNWRNPEIPGLWSSHLPWYFLIPTLLGGLQIMPIPAGLNRGLSPNGVRIQDFLTHENYLDAAALNSLVPEYEFRDDGLELRGNTISLVPSETRLQIAKYWTVFAYLLAGMFAIDTSARRQVFLTAIVANGVLIAIFSVFQKLLWGGQLFWRINSPWDAVLGPFFNKNNGAGFLLLVMSAAFALLALRIHRAHGKSNNFTQRHVGIAQSVVRLFNDNQTAAICLGLLFLWVGVLISMSRGGFAGAIIGTVTAATMIWWNYLTRVALASAIFAILVIALVSWTGQAESINDRIASISDVSEYQQTRFKHWCDDLRLASDFLILGIGLGAYPQVNQVYQSFYMPAWFRYSENQYLESLIVGGVFGISILFAFLVCGWRSVLRLLKQGRSDSIQVAALGAFALSSQMVAGFFDFGLYNAANGILFASIIGVVVGCAEQANVPGKDVRKFRLNYRAWIIATILLGVFSVRELALRANVEYAMNWSSTKMEFSNASPYATEPRVTLEIAKLRRALALYPNHSYGQARLANLHLVKFRNLLFADLVRLCDDKIPPDDCWSFTDLFNVSSRLRSEPSSSISRKHLVRTAAYRNHVLPAWKSLLASRSQNSFIPEVHYRMALLEPLVAPGANRTQFHLKRVVAIAPQDSEMLFNCGMVISQVGEREQSLEWIRRAAHLENNIPPYVAAFAKAYLSPEEFVKSVLPSDPDVLLDVIHRHFPDDQDRMWQVALGARAAELLNARILDEASAEDLYLIGLANFYSGKPQIACSYYEKAIMLQSGVAHWRLDYARSLEAIGETSSGLREAKLALRLKPKWWKAKQFVRKMEIQLAK